MNHNADQSEIVSALQAISLNISYNGWILIGSRAARRYLPNFRGVSSNDDDADWDMISSPSFLVKWLQKKNDEISKIDMITPTSDNNDDPLDLYIYCILTDGSKYDIAIPRSSTSYTTYLLNEVEKWTVDSYSSFLFFYTPSSHKIASTNLLLILKRYMLYYSNQWEKTAKDYRELLTVAPGFTDEDRTFCDLFIRYNEKLHGKRTATDTKDFIINATNSQQGITINQDIFFQQTKEEQILIVYKAALSLSFKNDIYTGLERICTTGPLWLADFTIENFVLIQQEKFNPIFRIPRSSIKCNIENYRLFPEIPELPTKRILSFIIDPIDLFVMQAVCKQWYTILNDQSFWKDLYISRYGQYPDQMNTIRSWKLLYMLRLEGKLPTDKMVLEQLMNTTIDLSRYKSNDLLKLWEDLTHEDQSIDSILVSKIDYILSHSFYYEMDHTSEFYTVRLILIGLEHQRSRSIVTVRLRVGHYGGSYFTDEMKKLSINFHNSSEKLQSIELLCPALFGFSIARRGYFFSRHTFFNQGPSEIYNEYPSGLLMCLFIMMTHPTHRSELISYLRRLEKHCCIHS